MGREIKRLPLDFEWELNKRWQGYLTPEALRGEPCDRCNGGETWANRWLYLFCLQINMLAKDVRDQEAGKPMHPWLATNPYPPFTWRPDPERKRGFVSNDYDVMRPSADIVDLIAGIAKRDPATVGGMFDGNTEYDLYKAIVEASGLDEWGTCQHCQGRGEHEKYEGQRAEREAWKPYEPPTGEGWQLWETVSEGSPISPVFSTAEKLAAWMAEPERGTDWVPEPVARRFIEAGWAPTGMGYEGEPPVSGVEFIGHHMGESA